MSHMVENGAYAYRPAWHNLGSVTEGLMTTREALALVPELDSTVTREPIFIRMTNGDFVEVPSTYANVRDFDERVVGVVGDRYEILQNRDAFSFMDTLLDTGDARISAAISLRGGSQVALVVEFPSQGIKVGGVDPVNLHAILSNSHDGTSGVTLFTSPIRVECWNMLQYALAGSDRKYVVRHTQSMNGKMKAARDVMEITFTAMADFSEKAERMLDTSFSDADFQKFLDSLIPVPEDEGRGRTRALNKRDAIESVYKSAPDLVSYQGTAWGVFNAVTAYDQHFATGRETDKSSIDENRFTRLMSGKSLSDTAASLLLRA